MIFMMLLWLLRLEVGMVNVYVNLVMMILVRLVMFMMLVKLVTLVRLIRLVIMRG